MKHNPSTPRLTRRDMLAATGAGLLVAAGMTIPAGPASADKMAVMAEIKKRVGTSTPTMGRVTIELPQIAENGRTVPVAVSVESPMTEKDYVKAVHIFAEKNPLPNVATFRFTPDSGRARAATRMRLAKTQNVVAVAEMSDGSVYMGRSAVKVTIGGCGG